MKYALNVFVDFNPDLFVDVLNGVAAPEAWMEFWDIRSTDRCNVYSKATASLRKLVDEWINSGLRENHSESTGERNEGRAPKASSRVNRFLRIARIDSLEVLPKRTWRFIPTWSRYEKPSSAPNQAIQAEWKISQIMTIVISTEVGSRIAKCRYEKCGRYFLLAERPNKTAGTNGLFCCTAHNRAATATKLSSNRRVKAHTELIEMATTELQKRKNIKPTWYEDKQLKTKLAIEISKRIALDPNHVHKQIKLNWVTRHHKEIQKRVEETSNVTRED
jgi:hypothetical protein